VHLFPLKVGIALFCLWHMAAIALYAMPLGSTSTLMQRMEQEARPKIRPYVLLTSQWQRWSLFSPDPLRQVTTFVIDAQENRAWQPRGEVSPETVAWWHRADELKIVRMLQKEERYAPLRERYVQLSCPTLDLEPGTNMRLRKRTAVIPLLEEWKPLSWWHSWELEWDEENDVETTCPPLPA